MNSGKYVFSQLVEFLPKRVFDMIVKRHNGDKWVKTFTVAVIEHDCKLGRTTFNVLRVVSRVLTDKMPVKDLFLTSETIDGVWEESAQLEFAFKY